MTDLERRVEEYMKNHFCKKVDEEYMVEECEEGECTRCIEYEVRKEMLIDFAQQETDLLSQHILELQKDKGRLTDENKQAKELLKMFVLKGIGNIEPSWNELIKNAEAFLKE